MEGFYNNKMSNKLSLSDKMIWEEDYLGWCRGKDVKEAVKELKETLCKESFQRSDVNPACWDRISQLEIRKQIDEIFGEKLVEGGKVK